MVVDKIVPDCRSTFWVPVFMWWGQIEYKKNRRVYELQKRPNFILTLKIQFL